MSTRAYFVRVAALYNNKKAELVNFNGGRVQPQSLDPKHALVFRVEIGGHMVCSHAADVDLSLREVVRKNCL